MRAIVAATAVFLLAGCQGEAAPEAESQTLHDVMLSEIDAPADALWDVSNAAIGDEGGLDPALMDDAKWDRIAELAEQVAAGAHTISTLDPITVAAPGVAIGDADVPGGHTAAQVQAAIDANPELFREMAQTLGMHVADLAAAARARDAASAGPLIDQLDGVCESCHLNFWYPEQREMVEQFQNEGVVDQDHPGLGPAAEGGE
ncbi:MAG: cytochrome c [Erythrobacter sp.]|nr:cytochrome c [Erythrobacter sp.]